MNSPFRFANRRALGAVAVSGLLLVPLGIFGGSALAHNGGPSASQYQYKVTICHQTHSKKHPWVRITISSSALPAHLNRHHDSTNLSLCPASSATHQVSSHDNGNDDDNGQGPGHDHGHHGKP